MDIFRLLAERPILNTFIVALISFLGYFFARLYKARMLFIERKRMGLVRTYAYSSLDSRVSDN